MASFFIVVFSTPLRTLSVSPPTVLRLFYGFCRRNVGGDTERLRMGGGAFLSVGVLADGLDGLAELFDVQLLVANLCGVCKVVAVGREGLGVVDLSFLEEAAGDGCLQIVERHPSVVPTLNIVLRKVFGYFLELLLWQPAFGIDTALQFQQVDPRGYGGFEGHQTPALFVAVVAQVGVTGLHEDDGANAYLTQY